MKACSHEILLNVVSKPSRKEVCVPLGAPPITIIT